MTLALLLYGPVNVISDGGDTLLKRPLETHRIRCHHRGYLEIIGKTAVIFKDIFGRSK